MWLPQSIIAEVEAVAHVHNIDAVATAVWNKHRRPGELRLLTGWAWTAKNGRSFRQGFKTKTVAFRDAYYALVQHAEAPPITRPRLRVVTRRAA